MKRINLVFVLAIAFALFVCASGVVSAPIYVPDNYTKIEMGCNCEGKKAFKGKR